MYSAAHSPPLARPKPKTLNHNEAYSIMKCTVQCSTACVTPDDKEVELGLDGSVGSDGSVGCDGSVVSDGSVVC